jgi:hypothetical protein
MFMQIRGGLKGAIEAVKIELAGRKGDYSDERGSRSKLQALPIAVIDEPPAKPRIKLSEAGKFCNNYPGGARSRTKEGAMRATSGIWGLVFFVALFGCEGSSKPPDTATRSGSGASTSSPGLIALDSLTRCAGVTVEKAATIVGASPAELTDYSKPQERWHLCAYVNQKDRSKAVSFTLSRRDSVEQAAASMRSERESMGMAQGSIDRATGSKSKDKAFQDVSGIGDEAFYSPLNDAIMLRVANVIAQVTAPGDMALKKRAAEEVARGLRQ